MFETREETHAVRLKKSVLRVTVLTSSGVSAPGATVNLGDVPGEEYVRGASAKTSEDGIAVFSVERDRACSPWSDRESPRLPAGAYRLKVEAQDKSAAGPLGLYLPIERDVVIQPQAVVDLSLTARPGGRIRLTLTGPPEVPQPPAGSETWSVVENLPQEVRLVVKSIRARLVTSEGEERDLHFFRSRSSGSGVLSWLTPGEPMLSAFPLPPGDFILEVSASGFRTAKSDVRLDDGRITNVRVDLEVE